MGLVSVARWGSQGTWLCCSAPVAGLVAVTSSRSCVGSVLTAMGDTLLS